MIKVDKNTSLTYKNLKAWISEWEKDKERLQTLDEAYKNRTAGGKAVFKLPYAKKLVTTSSSATVGDGVTLSAPELEGKELATFEQLKKLFEAQTVVSHDRKVIKEGCIFGRGYELIYFSSDREPIPKVAAVKAKNTFVVFDNTVEKNSLYAVCFERYNKNGESRLSLSVYDDIYIYDIDIKESELDRLGDMALESDRQHYMGRVPITEYHNNEEEQGDFEQLIDLMHDRTWIHNLNMRDLRKIAKNYLKTRNIDLPGNTKEEINKTQEDMSYDQRVDVPLRDELDTVSDIAILSKSEDYSSIEVLGRDIDSKIYDLSMVPDLSAEAFAGNQTGVALKIKLMPFKDLVESKDEEIEKLYQRRVKMYAVALEHKNPSLYTSFDISKVKIDINRNWTENIAELAATISALFPTGLFSDELLINLFSKADYNTELERKEREAELRREAQAKNPDPIGQSTEWLASLLAGDRRNDGG